MVNWLCDILVSSRNHFSIFRCSSCAAPAVHLAAGLIYSSKIPGVMTSTLISGRLL